MSRSYHKRQPYGHTERGGFKPRTQRRRSEEPPPDRGQVGYRWVRPESERGPDGRWQYGSGFSDEVLGRVRALLKRWQKRSPGFAGGADRFEVYVFGAPGPDLRDKVRELVKHLGWPTHQPEGQPRL